MTARQRTGIWLILALILFGFGFIWTSQQAMAASGTERVGWCLLMVIPFVLNIYVVCRSCQFLLRGH